ncbi:uncharacterized protein LOC105178281 [Sesamum indicum]|uniref:Uncharacterized protein LOC105178281 n=1 Tax=Sesamum indicum TaxID=4182 RepID=A0A6I9UFA9_SESIN|nr:uncharacterized protein LOC105178281 [Sesamum indicum]
MAWSEAEVVCRNHPNQNPQPGVCPSCLRERLSRITSNNCPSSPSFSSSPAYGYYSSASSSGCSSPAEGRRRGYHQRVASDVLDSIYFAMGGSSSGLKKSRSMAFAPRSMGGRDGVSAKKKGGFWNRLLLRSGGKKSKF